MTRPSLRRLGAVLLAGCLLSACSSADPSPEAEDGATTPASASPETEDAGEGKATGTAVPSRRPLRPREQEVMAALRGMGATKPAPVEHGYRDNVHVGGNWRGRFVLIHSAGRAKYHKNIGKTVDETTIAGLPARIVQVQSSGTWVHLKCARDYLALSSHPSQDVFGSDRQSAVAFARNLVPQMRCS